MTKNLSSNYYSQHCMSYVFLGVTSKEQNIFNCNNLNYLHTKISNIKV